MRPTLPAAKTSKPYVFDKDELERLAVYRAAIVARFFTDQIDPAGFGVGIDPERLLESVGEGC